MIKFLMRAYKNEELTEEEMEKILALLEQLGFQDVLTEEHNENEKI